MRVFINLTGRQFSRWAVVYAMPKTAKEASRFWCKCQCGIEKPVLSADLIQNKSTNCGCVRREKIAARNAKHGASVRGIYNPTYEAWKHMKARCLNIRSKDYSYYGGRGIQICDEWIASFEAFYADMGECLPLLTLERNNVNGHYEPANCRWATRKEQTANRRPFKQEGLRGENATRVKLTNADVICIRSIPEGRPQSDIAREFGVSQTLISAIKRRTIWSHI